MKIVHSSVAEQGRKPNRFRQSVGDALRRFWPLTIGLVSVLSLAGAGTATAASRVFADDFETGTWNGAWSLDTGYASWPEVLSVAHDGGTAKSGGKMLALNWNGNVAWNNPLNRSGLVLKSWPYAKEFLIRYWMRMDKDFGASGSTFYGDAGDGLGTGCKLFRLNDAGPNGDYVVFMMQGGTSHEQWSADSYFINNWNGDKGAMLGRGWHKVEMYVLQDAANGVVKRWQDGVLMYSYTGRTSDSASNPYFPWYLASNWSTNPGWGHGTNNHVYIDNVEIYSDAGSGTSATGSMADASIIAAGGGAVPPPVTALSPPTNLRTLP
jgi:hypothetical protein